MPNKKSVKSVVVFGDVTMDWNLATSLATKGANLNWSQDINSSLFWQRGGASQLADMIESISKTLPADKQYIVQQNDMPLQGVFPFDKRYHHSFTMWTPFKYSEDAPKEKTAWRVEHFLGIDRSSENIVPSMQVIKHDSFPQLVVLDDGGLDFRNKEALWPQALSALEKT